MHNFISVQDIDTNFSCIVGFSGSTISNMISTISRVQGSCNGNQIWAKWTKIEQNFLSRWHRLS